VLLGDLLACCLPASAPEVLQHPLDGLHLPLADCSRGMLWGKGQEKAAARLLAAAVPQAAPQSAASGPLFTQQGAGSPRQARLTCLRSPLVART
jgi:hypothetical protein